jgi:hypothetical protein
LVAIAWIVRGNFARQRADGGEDGHQHYQQVDGIQPHRRTKVNVRTELCTAAGEVVLEGALNCNVRFVGSNLRATHNLAHNVAKLIHGGSMAELAIKQNESDALEAPVEEGEIRAGNPPHIGGAHHYGVSPDSFGKEKSYDA